MLKGFVRKTVLTAVICVCFASAAFAGPFKAIVNRPSQKKVQFSVKIINASTGGTVFEHNAHKAMVPASNMKIITSAAALAYLGADYQFTTRIGLLGDTLVIIGGGDPLLGDEITDLKYARPADRLFADITEALKQKGIVYIDDIVADSTFFDDNRVHPNWPAAQLNQPYACETSGLNYNLNCIKINAANTNGRIKLTLTPPTSYIEIVNKVVAISKKTSAAGAYRTNKPNKLIVRGKCRKETAFDVAIERPAAFFGYLLYEHLTTAGIDIRGGFVEKFVKKAEMEILCSYTTPICDVLARCNKNSLGLAAEALVKTISAENTAGKINGQWQHGFELIERYLLRLGIDGGEFRLDDGSGLSRQNLLTAHTITEVLLDVYEGPNRQFYIDSLAVGGVDGTIGKYFKDKKYKGRIFGKTGYIEGVKSFSGVCSTSRGDYIFSILTNSANGQTRKAINDIAKAIIDNAD